MSSRVLYIQSRQQICEKHEWGVHQTAEEQKRQLFVLLEKIDQASRNTIKVSIAHLKEALSLYLPATIEYHFYKEKTSASISYICKDTLENFIYTVKALENGMEHLKKHLHSL